VVLRWGVLGGIVRRVIKSRQFKDLRASARLARHHASHVFSSLEAGPFLRTLLRHGSAATGAESFARRLTV
jgi:hypothetical protein